MQKVIDEMKVLFVINAFDAPSGAEHVLLDYLKTEKRIIPGFLIIGPHSESQDLFTQVTERKNIFYIHASNQIQSLLSRFFLFKAYRYMLCIKVKENDTYKKLNSKRDFDVIYYNNSFESMTFYSLFPGAKKVIHIHDMIDMFRPAQKRCIVSVCRKAKQIIAVSEACSQMLSKNGIDPSKISVVHNSIDIEPQAYIAKQSDALVIGFVGSVIHRKGFDLYVDILNGVDNEIKKRQQGVRSVKALIITNSHKDSEFLRANINRLNEDIEKNEYYSIPRKEVLSLYPDMDILVVPSRFDPLPTVVLESYLSGTPVIGTAKDGMLEMQTEKQMMFDINDVDCAIRRILDWADLSEDRKKELVSNTQKYIQSEFTAENKRERVYSVLQKVVNGE